MHHSACLELFAKKKRTTELDLLVLNSSSFSKSGLARLLSTKLQSELESCHESEKFSGNCQLLCFGGELPVSEFQMPESSLLRLVHPWHWRSGF